MTVSSRSSPPRGCDVICGGTSPLCSSLPSGTRSPGSGGRACEETPRQPGGRREQNGSSASDAGFLQEPVRACFRPSCHPRHRHAHQQSHTERWDYRAQACSSKREGFEGINMSAPPPLCSQRSSPTTSSSSRTSSPTSSSSSRENHLRLLSRLSSRDGDQKEDWSCRRFW